VFASLLQGIAEKVLLTIILGALAIAWTWLKAKYERKPLGTKRAIIVSALILTTALCLLETVWYVTSPTRFDIRLSQDDGGIGPWADPNEKVTFGYMTISGVNTGSPTILRVWHMQLEADDGKKYDGENTFLSPQGAQPTLQDQMTPYRQTRNSSSYHLSKRFLAGEDCTPGDWNWCGSGRIYAGRIQRTTCGVFQ
jgi:hypothetical protein